MTKQTAGNNSLLRDIKDAMNAPVYKHCLGLINEGESLGKREQGEANAVAYLAQFFTSDARKGVAAIATLVRQGRK